MCVDSKIKGTVNAFFVALNPNRKIVYQQNICREIAKYLINRYLFAFLVIFLIATMMQMGC